MNKPVTFNNITFTDKTKLIEYLIMYSIRLSYDKNKSFIESKILTLTIYTILRNILVNMKKIIFLDAPTGTGKSIIGYMIHFCFNWLDSNYDDIINNNYNPDTESKLLPITTYTLTSSKILQEQFESDFIKFGLFDHFNMLKGQNNYECKTATRENKIYTDYTNRACIGMKISDIEKLPCFAECEYIQRRHKASISPSAVINYSYFITVMNSSFNNYFSKRQLTIADEGHLIPQIVSGMFTIDINMFKLNKMNKILSQVSLSFSKTLSNQIEILEKRIIKLYSFFETNNTNSNKDLSSIINYFNYFKQTVLCFKSLLNNESNHFANESDYEFFKGMFQTDINKLFDSVDNDYETNISYLESLIERPKDIHISYEIIGSNKYFVNGKEIPEKTYQKIIVRDLSEAELVRKKFIDKTDILVIMSATIGNVDDFAKMLGLDKSEYVGFNLPSEFDFTNSPIYLCKSGYLNYNNFKTNIHKVLEDTCKLLMKYHPNDKGIIHTSTFEIARILKDYLLRYDNDNFNRYLFYESAEEKDFVIEKMKKDTESTPYVIIGPSLYEGIDLKDDLGRFNIIVKAPYSGLDDFTRNKIKRYPFWYERETIEKLQQAIGRTNRHKNDWSKVYLMDSLLDKLIWKLPNYITSRVQSKVIR